MAEGQEKPPWGVSSEMTELNFIPSSACARRRVSERNRRTAAALSAEMTTELLAGGLFEKLRRPPVLRRPLISRYGCRLVLLPVVVDVLDVVVLINRNSSSFLIFRL